MEWDKDMAKCEEKMRNERKLDAILGEPKYAAEEQSTILDEPQEVEHKFRSYLRRLNHDEKADQNGYTYFDPWDPEIMRSIWFYGYEGSLTEPPCSEFGKCIYMLFAFASPRFLPSISLQLITYATYHLYSPPN